MRQPTRLQQVGLGRLAVLLGLIAAEGIARIQSDGAFPHANFYVPDDDLGVCSSRATMPSNSATTRSAKSW